MVIYTLVDYFVNMMNLIDDTHYYYSVFEYKPNLRSTCYETYLVNNIINDIMPLHVHEQVERCNYFFYSTLNTFLEHTILLLSTT